MLSVRPEEPAWTNQVHHDAVVGLDDKPPSTGPLARRLNKDS